eukprot:COSAG01_NODE_6763_length_3508_cov_49.836364_1_plen_187_part_10
MPSDMMPRSREGLRVRQPEDRAPGHARGSALEHLPEHLEHQREPARFGNAPPSPSLPRCLAGVCVCVCVCIVPRRPLRPRVRCTGRVVRAVVPLRAGGQAHSLAVPDEVRLTSCTYYTHKHTHTHTVHHPLHSFTTSNTSTAASSTGQIVDSPQPCAPPHHIASSLDRSIDELCQAGAELRVLRQHR